MASVNFKFELGDKVRDTITLIVGIVTSRTQFYNNCIRYGVQPQATKDEKPAEVFSYDEEQLELVDAQAVPPRKLEQTGGPQDHSPSQRRA